MAREDVVKKKWRVGKNEQSYGMGSMQEGVKHLDWKKTESRWPNGEKTDV